MVGHQAEVLMRITEELEDRVRKRIRYDGKTEPNDTLLGGARGSIRNKWDDWCARGILRWIPQFPCDYSWMELKQVLQEMP